MLSRGQAETPACYEAAPETVTREGDRKVVPQGPGTRGEAMGRRGVTYQKYHSRWMESARTQHRDPQQSS